jgi:hypothetical protein
MLGEVGRMRRTRLPALPVVVAVLAAAGMAPRAPAEEPDAVIETRPLTAVGQHSPTVADTGGWLCMLRYSVRADGALGQDLFVRRVDGSAERQLTSTSLVLHPSWRRKNLRIVCIAVPDRPTKARPVGVYDLDASGDSPPNLLCPYQRERAPVALEVSPDDTRLLLVQQSADTERPGRYWLFLWDLRESKLLGEIPPPDEPFRLALSASPWWHSATQIRVVGEEVTEEGIEQAVYQYQWADPRDIARGKWKRIFRFARDERPSSVSYSASSKRLAYLRPGSAPDRADVVICGDDGRDPRVVYTATTPVKHLPRPFADDTAWLPDGDALVVTSGPNLVYLKLGKPGSTGTLAARANLERLYAALVQYAEDHGTKLPHWDDNKAVYGTPESDPFFWVAALAGTYIEDPSIFRSPSDPRDRATVQSSFVLNPSLAGRRLDQIRELTDTVLLEEAERWRPEGRLVLYGNGKIAVVDAERTPESETKPPSEPSDPDHPLTRHGSR